MRPIRTGRGQRLPQEITGTGVVIEGKRILTNAHVVLYASQVQVQANQAGDKISATVEAVAPGIDLAVLKLDDESSSTPTRRWRAPATCPRSRTRSWPTASRPGGTTCPSPRASSRASNSSPTTIRVSGLRIQIDAAINPGNSGGPAVAGDKMIGLAFSRLGEAQNIGYIIPSEEIELFLKDIADGHYDGKPACSMISRRWKIRRCALSEARQSVSGHHRPPARTRRSPDYPLKEWDVITRIGDTPVDDQGMIKISDDLRVELPLHDPEDRQGRQRAADRRARRQDHDRRVAACIDRAPAAGSGPARRVSVVLHLRAAGVFRAPERSSAVNCLRQRRD